MTNRNFDKLEPGGEYESGWGMRYIVVGEGADGWWVGYRKDDPGAAYSWLADGSWSGRLGNYSLDLLRKIEPKREWRVMVYAIEKPSGAVFFEASPPGGYFTMVSPERVIARRTITLEEGEGME